MRVAFGFDVLLACKAGMAGICAASILESRTFTTCSIILVYSFVFGIASFKLVSMLDWIGCLLVFAAQPLLFILKTLSLSALQGRAGLHV